MRNTTRLAATILAAAGLLITGCGSDDDNSSAPSSDVSAEAKPFVDALKRSMQESDDDTFELSDSQIDCLAPRMINAIGVDFLVDAGVDPADIGGDDDMDFSDLNITKDQGGAMYDSFGACDVSVRDIMLESVAGEGLGDEAQKCVEDALTEDSVRDMMIATLVEGDEGMESNPAIGELMGELMQCSMLDAQG